MDLPFLFVAGFFMDFLISSFNPYSNGSSFFIRRNGNTGYCKDVCFNPYSNGSSFFIFSTNSFTLSQQKVSILILMDLPFLSIEKMGEQGFTELFQSLF